MKNMTIHAYHTSLLLPVLPEVIEPTGFFRSHEILESEKFETYN